MLLSDGAPADVGLMNGGLADTTPMRIDASYYGGLGLHLTGAYASYSQLYRDQPWVHTLVRKLGTSTARLPLKTYRRTDKGRVDASTTPYGDLMRRPNPHIGAKFLWLWVASTYELYGESMLLKLRDDNGRVRELHPMHPTNVLIRRQPDGTLAYLYMASGRGGTLLAPFPASEVVHFRNYNPDNINRGISPCEPLRQTLLAEDSARRAQSSMWRNGAKPGFALTAPKALSDPVIKRLKAAFDGQHGGVDNWMKTLVLEEGLTPTALQITPEDMQYVEGRRLNREECCAVWDVPPPAVQILDRATFSNITEQMRSLYRETMAPRLNGYEDTLETQLAPDFDRSGDTYAEFLLDEVLRGAFEARSTANAQAIQTGQKTPNEARREDNKPDLPGGDQLFINAALIPLQTAVAKPPADSETEPAAKALSHSDARAIAGRLGRLASVDDIDEAVLLRNLDGDVEEVRALVRAAQHRGEDIPTLRSRIAAIASIDPVSEEIPA